MKLFKKINTNINLKILYLYLQFFLMNNLIAFGSDNKSEFIKTINEDQFEETFLEIPYL